MPDPVPPSDDARPADPVVLPFPETPSAVVTEPAPNESSRRSRRTPKEPSKRIAGLRVKTVEIGAIALLAGLGGALAGGHPTIYPAVDVILRALLAAGVTVTTARARRWSWLLLAGAAAAGSVISDAGALAVAFAWSALVLTGWCVVADVRRRRAGAIVGALAINALLRLGDTGPYAGSAVLVAAAIVPVAVSAYRLSTRLVRRRVRRTAYAVAGLIVLAGVGLVVAAISGANDVDTGMSEARAALASVRSGDEAATTDHLDRSNASFQSAHDSLEAWYTQPARLVPLLSFQADSLARLSSVGNQLAGVGAQVAQGANYHDLDVNDGQINVTKIVALDQPLGDVQQALTAATTSVSQIDTDWMAPPIRDRLDGLDDDLSQATDETSTARQAVQVAPQLLGEQGVRHYFIAFVTPAETRGIGGFMGNWAELTADHGHLSLSRTGRSTELGQIPDDSTTLPPGTPVRTLGAPADYVDRYGPYLPQYKVGDIGLSPDFPSVAQAIESVYPQTPGGTTVDGVISVDPFALAAMLRLTGPIKVNGLSTPLNANNAADILLHQQYLTFTKDNANRVDFLDEASRKTFDAFIHSNKIQPAALANDLGPMVQQRRVLASSTHPAEQALIDRLGMTGAFPRSDGNDLMGLVTQNAGNNKIDVYLHREIDYRVTINPSTGAVDTTVDIKLHNDAPASGVPDVVIGNRADSHQPPGVDWTWLNFYSPHDLVSATLDGQSVNLGSHRELGVNVYDTHVAVPSKGDATLEIKLHGTIAPNTTYQLDWFQQAVINPDRVAVTVRPAAGWSAADSQQVVNNDGEVTVTTQQPTDGEVSVPLERH
jgi:hypothetical protein